VERIVRFIRQEAAALWIFALVFMAGALNAAGFLQYGQTLSHMTGNLTKLGLTMTGQCPEPFWWFFVFILSFILGATVSGYAFPTHSRGQWRRCGLVLISSGALLLLSAFVHGVPPLRMTLLALVLGAQNGLALRYRGILTRTTHVTGHLTDLGAAIGRMIKARAFLGENLRPFMLHLCALLFFLLGVVTISLTHTHLPGAFGAIDLCGFLYVLLGGLMLLNLFKA
jgi:uncharacterized membrane protein YoaK (UPF0700 family)